MISEGGICIPDDCIRNENISPATKIFVSHLVRTSEWASPSVRRMMRPKAMYILAAKRAGATSRRRDCKM